MDPPLRQQVAAQEVRGNADWGFRIADLKTAYAFSNHLFSAFRIPQSAFPNPMFLSAQHITKTFGAFTALDRVSLDVEAGEFVSILGPSGCGKTTLLRVIAGLEPQDSGSVWIGGQDLSRAPVAKRGLGIVFQSYALFPNLSIERNVAYGLRGMSPAARRERAREMLDLVGLADQALKFPAQLSGGQQQRVALARALAPKPSLLLLDEPLSALDARVRVRLRAEIRNIQQKLGVTTIMVTHDQEEALTMADRILVMNRGRLMQFADPRLVYAEPSNAFVAEFIGAMNFLPGCRRSGPRQVSFLQHKLETSGKEVLRENTDTLCLAIRPEHVHPATPDAPNRLTVRVVHVEFRGPVFRATLRVLHPGGEPSEHCIDMDLTPRQADAHRLAVGADLEVQLPPAHLLAFSGDASREAEDAA
jgi:iron(III) transport system ATP-binding protein